MLDPCFWCGRNKCRHSHERVILQYRLRLHKQAVAKLKQILQPGVLGEIQTLLSLRPEHMGIEEHRLKSHYKENVKTMSPEQAWLKAQKQNKDESTLSLLPRFTRQ